MFDAPPCGSEADFPDLREGFRVSREVRPALVEVLGRT
jgi:hypothetical protein